MHFSIYDDGSSVEYDPNSHVISHARDIRVGVSNIGDNNVCVVNHSNTPRIVIHTFAFSVWGRFEDSLNSVITDGYGNTAKSTKLENALGSENYPPEVTFSYDSEATGNFNLTSDENVELGTASVGIG